MKKAIILYLWENYRNANDPKTPQEAARDDFNIIKKNEENTDVEDNEEEDRDDDTQSKSSKPKPPSKPHITQQAAEIAIGLNMAKKS